MGTCSLCYVLCALWFVLGTWRLVLGAWYLALGTLCGSAALRAESLWLSVIAHTISAAPPPRHSLKVLSKGSRKAVGFPHGGRQSRTAYQAPSTKLQALSTRHKSQLSWHCLSLIKRCSCQGREYRSDQMKCANLQPKRIGKEAERNKLRRTSK